MTRLFQATELEPIATFWRIHRRDGVSMGFTSHDRDLWFDGVLHRAAPGMLPSAIRRSAGLDADSADVEGVLSHDSISAKDLADGRFDGARVKIGVVDWETLDRAVLYHGTIGAVGEEANGFAAELRSAKTVLETDTVPRTSPTCRASFCGPGCTHSAAAFTHEATLMGIDLAANSVSFSDSPAAELFRDGFLRWLDGPQAGLTMQIQAISGESLMLDAPLDPELVPGVRALLRQGCDHTIQTCADRFHNAANFQGEPFLPGNDLLVRYPAPAS